MKNLKLKMWEFRGFGVWRTGGREKRRASIPNLPGRWPALRRQGHPRKVLGIKGG